MITVFLVISAPGAFEIEMKHCCFKPAIIAPYLLWDSFDRLPSMKIYDYANLHKAVNSILRSVERPSEVRSLIQPIEVNRLKKSVYIV